jgi:hypothetical protein
MNLSRLDEIKARASAYEEPARQDICHLIAMVQDAHKTIRGEQDCRSQQMALLSQRSDEALELRKQIRAAGIGKERP